MCWKAKFFRYRLGESQSYILTDLTSQRSSSSSSSSSSSLRRSMTMILNSCTPTSANRIPPTLREFSTLLFPGTQNGYCHGGDRILSQDSSDYSASFSKLLALQTRKIYRTEAEVTFLLHGFWSESSGKLCMVGQLCYSREGELLDLAAVLKLNNVKNLSTVTDLVGGTLESLNLASDSNYFEPISIIALLLVGKLDIFPIHKHKSKSQHDIDWEGWWDAKNNRLCVVACRILNTMQSLANAHIGVMAWGSAAPFFVGDNLYDPFEYGIPSSSSEPGSSVVEANARHISPVNISYKISFTLEPGAEFGGIISPFSESLGSGNEGYIKGSIESTREKSDPLTSNVWICLQLFQVSLKKAVHWEDGIGDHHGSDVQHPYMFLCGLQLLHVKKSPEALPSISLAMLVILTFGFMIPLVMNFEALSWEALLIKMFGLTMADEQPAFFPPYELPAAFSLEGLEILSGLFFELCPSFDGSWSYANPGAGFYTTAWNAMIPCGSLLFAVVLFLQQKYGGLCILPRGLRARSM
ncbi:hypothetical protein CK203_031379 [Vitis vinifera]|uniref:RING-type E3 ubiquitin transferase n=1 Tax=Vitis vinifera TaxID=29760 RepID=A0A438I8S9_VITVI|nr:hypothetical protein CK203_031379 [Vitis vinifera]